MNDSEFIEIFQRNATKIRHILHETPAVFGDAKRLQFNSRFHPHDLLINTMSGNVVIGEDVFFGSEVMLLTGTHDTSKLGAERVESIPKLGRDIIIEKGAWVASGAIVLGPCRIGEHAVIAAGSVVRSDVEPFAIYAGNPARKVATVST